MTKVAFIGSGKIGQTIAFNTIMGGYIDETETEYNHLQQHVKLELVQRRKKRVYVKDLLLFCG